ncbi:MAG: ABC transporter ATP-binding protein [Oxalobacter sp.]|nr:MAG: ABC transporter ATP-binding protein [Oxalobacter sp.]
MIQLQNVSKQFLSGRGHVAAISGISFSVQKGEGVILAGRSGSGKTTLLNCIGTLETPDSGAILFNGINIGALSASKRAQFRKREVGFVFQASNLLPWLTVAENLQVPLELNNIRGSEQGRRIAVLLETFGLAGYDKAMPVELSAGESQRIAFARAIAHSPAILLADEPTASLDSGNGKQLIELTFSLCRNNGTTLIIATHDPDVMAMADTVITLKDGRQL